MSESKENIVSPGAIKLSLENWRRIKAIQRAAEEKHDKAPTMNDVMGSALDALAQGKQSAAPVSASQTPLSRMLDELLKRKPDTYHRIIGQVEAHLGKSLEDFDNELKPAATGKSRKSA